MPFNSETAREYGARGGRKGGKVGGKSTSERKLSAAHANLKLARERGLVVGRPAGSCNCGREVHVYPCRVYLAQKKRESRERLAGQPDREIKKKRKRRRPAAAAVDRSILSETTIKAVQVEVADVDDLSWLSEGIYPTRPKDIQKGRSRKAQ